MPRPPKLFPLALKLLKPGGEVRGFYGAELHDVEQAAQSAGLSVVQSIAYALGESQRLIYQLRPA